MNIIDGRKIAEEIKKKLREKLKSFDRQLKLAIIYAGKNPAIDQFLKIKKDFGEEIGVKVNIYRYPDDITAEKLLAEIKKVSNSSSGVIVQLPLPEGLPVEEILAAIPKERDVDALSGSSLFESPVVLAVREIFSRYGIKLENKTIAVVGRGRLVGGPIIRSLLKEGHSPIVINKENPDFSKLRKADIIISGAGTQGLIKKEMIKEGVVLIDAGTSESYGKISGDVDPGCYAAASLYTRVPGGIGPITVAKLYENLLKSGSQA